MLSILLLNSCFLRSISNDPLPELKNSDEYNNLMVVPAMDVRIDPEKTIIYCSTFQLAWNELININSNKSVTLSNNPDIVPHLNNKSFTRT